MSNQLINSSASAAESSSDELQHRMVQSDNAEYSTSSMGTFSDQSLFSSARPPPLTYQNSGFRNSASLEYYSNDNNNSDQESKNTNKEEKASRSNHHHHHHHKNDVQNHRPSEKSESLERRSPAVESSTASTTSSSSSSSSYSFSSASLSSFNPKSVSTSISSSENLASSHRHHNNHEMIKTKRSKQKPQLQPHQQLFLNQNHQRKKTVDQIECICDDESGVKKFNCPKCTSSYPIQVARSKDGEESIMVTMKNKHKTTPPQNQTTTTTSAANNSNRMVHSSTNYEFNRKHQSNIPKDIFRNDYEELQMLLRLSAQQQQQQRQQADKQQQQHQQPDNNNHRNNRKVIYQINLPASSSDVVVQPSYQVASLIQNYVENKMSSSIDPPPNFDLEKLTAAAAAAKN